MMLRLGMLLLALFAPCVGAIPEGEAPPAPPEREDREAHLEAAWLRAWEAESYAEAAELLDELLTLRPTDKFVAYNLACARAQVGDVDAAAETLLDALSLGFVDFHHMQRDESLTPLHADHRWRAILENWSRLLDTRADAELQAMEKAFGGGYVTDRSAELRLNYVAAFAPPEFEAAQQEIRRVAAWVGRIMPIAPEDDPQPDPWVTVILPTQEDFVRLIGIGRVGGIYDKDAKRLVSRDIGPSLRHEFVHVLHWRHMDRLGQRHPIWLQEGLASLVEDIEERGAEGMRIRPSWRTNIASRLARGARLTPWSRLFAMERDDFVLRRPRANYAQARAVVLFLHEQGKLGVWYRTYVDRFDEDATGLRAFEEVFDLPARDVERQYRVWLAELEQVADIDRPGAASLGIALSPGRGDGPMVDQVVSMIPGEVGGRPGERLRFRDVITAIDGTSLRTLDELYRLLGAYDECSELGLARASTQAARRASPGSRDD
ncbi:MAG: hypothetical protein AAFX05_02520, partial [Planctomycetota bacterium]